MNNIKGPNKETKRTVETILHDLIEETYRDAYSDGFEKGKEFVREQKGEVKMKRMYVWEIKPIHGITEKLVTERTDKKGALEDYFSIFGRTTIISAEYITSVWGR